MGVAAFQHWTPVRETARVEVEPLLASWEARDHPQQVALRTYLDHLEATLGPALASAKPGYLLVDVVLDRDLDLLVHRDLENYLTPVAQRLRPEHLVLARARKRHAAHPDDRSTIRVGLAAPGSPPEDLAGTSASPRGSTAKSEWKATLREGLIRRGVSPAPDGPLRVHLCWRCSAIARNWVNLWKPTGDALGPILGEPVPTQPFHPADDRIVDLALHLTPDDSLGYDVEVGVRWARVDGPGTPATRLV